MKFKRRDHAVKEQRKLKKPSWSDLQLHDSEI